MKPGKVQIGGEFPEDEETEDIEIEWQQDGWAAFFNGLLIAHGFPSRKALVDFLKRKYPQDPIAK